MFFELERARRILKDLKDYIYPKREPIDYFLMKEGDYSNPKDADQSNQTSSSRLDNKERIETDNILSTKSDNQQWAKLNRDQTWGGKDRRFWFKTMVRIPEDFKNKTVVFSIKTGREKEWDALNPQFLIYLDGEVIQGLDTNHREIVIVENAEPGQEYRIDLHGYAGMQGEQVHLKGEIAVLDRDAEKLYYDIKIALDVAELLEEDDKRRVDILNYMRGAINILDLRKPYSYIYYESLKEAQEFMDKVFYDGYCGKGGITVSCVGHTHIDVAWLWTLKQTREKVARSFSTVLNLMKEYPEYIFMSSQPQLYKYLKEDHPNIYEKVRKKVREGRWEADGGMWLEADCNLASGESLIRQILFGRRFFKEEFGVDSKILWLPDVFGYSAALPQILKRFGMKYFMTTKISWNEYNKIPYDTFMWQGLDGSEILTHFITTIDYNLLKKGTHRTRYEGVLGAAEVKGAWQRYQQKGINDKVLISFGHGDGGGGATREMLENARRLERGIPGCPKVKMERAGEFFDKLEETTMKSGRVPKWVGELYLEYHRGTYTTMARNKRYNRKCELLLKDVENFSVIHRNTGGSEEYPREDINRSWETVLLNQFHDIIPGSSIKEVYDESKVQYEGVIREGERLINKALEGIASEIDLKSKSIVVFNGCGYNRDDILEFDIPIDIKNPQLRDEKGELIPVQTIDKNRCVAFLEDIPSVGYKSFEIFDVSGSEDKIQKDKERVWDKKISNKFFDIVFDDKGHIISIYDKRACREVIKDGECGNVIQAFEDKPHLWDAWDINIYYGEKMWEVDHISSMNIVECGPVRTVLEIQREFLDSRIKQRIHVYEDIPRIDFETEVDWKEEHILLKAAFPVDIHTSKATYDVQFGNVERPTHWNTSWDTAKFEVCGHKWADLSEGDYGVSLMNDCKYGYDIKDGVMRLTLLKSPTWPNPEADKEIHRFTYSLYPHEGDWISGRTEIMGSNLNSPMYAIAREKQVGIRAGSESFIHVSGVNVMIDAIKQAEDEEAIIVRLHEYQNKRSHVRVELFWNPTDIYECDLNEENKNELDVMENGFDFEMKPYEIRTFKVIL